MNSKYGRKAKEVNLAVDIVALGITDKKLHILLIKGKKNELNESWVLPGGLVSFGNSLEEEAQNVLKRKTGINKILLDQLATFGNPKRDPFGHVVSVVYIALINIDEYILKTTMEYSGIAWFDINNLPKIGYDHKEIISVAKNRLENKIMYTNIAQGILDDEFTLTELQDTYEIILEKTFDKRNFRKKILALGILEELNKKKIGTSRPATLYKFSSDKIKEYNISK